jgi:hypothetical protein
VGYEGDHSSVPESYPYYDKYERRTRRAGVPWIEIIGESTMYCRMSSATSKDLHPVMRSINRATTGAQNLNRRDDSSENSSRITVTNSQNEEYILVSS